MAPKSLSQVDIDEYRRKRRLRRRLILGLSAAAVISVIVIAILTSFHGEEVPGITLDGAPVLGPSTATVTVVEFSDFECSACGSFARGTLPTVKSTYIDTGKVRWGFRHFPIPSLHPEARPAAIASMCTYEQDKFWQFHDILYERQQDWGGKGVTYANDKFREYAGELNMDIVKFNSCLSSGKFDEKIDKDLSDGTKYGVTATPSFFINGHKVEGALPFDQFAPYIESELEKATAEVGSAVLGRIGDAFRFSTAGCEQYKCVNLRLEAPVGGAART